MILTLNAGSSSLKFAVFATEGGRVLPKPQAEGLVERIGVDGSATFERPGQKLVQLTDLTDHAAALTAVVGFLKHEQLLGDVEAVGHRVVHGGERFREPTLVTDEVELAVERLSPLAPLHNPVNLAGIREAKRVLAKAELGHVLHVAVFDTAFHATLPEVAFRYAVPTEWYEQLGVRRYGFHGTSHAYVSRTAGEFLADNGRPNSKIITLHLGNGCSAAAVLNGVSVDTSMGLTPLAGLVMGTRSGDFDPGAASYLAAQGISLDEQTTALNKASGLLGIAGDNDVRSLLAMRGEGSASAKLALAVFVYAIRKTVGAYAAVLGGLDALVFTAGIGENATAVRAEVCAGLEFLGLALDHDANANRGDGIRAIHRGDGAAILVVPTQEEYEIAHATAQLV